jgi:hypothetical protein
MFSQCRLCVCVCVYERTHACLSLLLSLSLSVSLCACARMLQLEHERMSDGNSREADRLSRQSASPPAHLRVHFSGISPLYLRPCPLKPAPPTPLAIPRKRHAAHWQAGQKITLHAAPLRRSPELYLAFLSISLIICCQAAGQREGSVLTLPQVLLHINDEVLHSKCTCHAYHSHTNF